MSWIPRPFKFSCLGFHEKQQSSLPLHCNGDTLPSPGKWAELGFLATIARDKNSEMTLGMLTVLPRTVQFLRVPK